MSLVSLNSMTHALVSRELIAGRRTSVLTILLGSILNNEKIMEAGAKNSVLITSPKFQDKLDRVTKMRFVSSMWFFRPFEGMNSNRTINELLHRRISIGMIVSSA